MGTMFYNIMEKIELFFLLFGLSGMLIITYKGYALQKGWPIGEYFMNDGSLLRTFGTLVLFGGFIASFFYVKWYQALLGLVTVWLVGGFVTALLKEKTQVVSVFLFFVSFVFLLF